MAVLYLIVSSFNSGFISWKKKERENRGEKLPQFILNWTWKEQQETNLMDFSVNKNIIKNVCEGVMTSPPCRGPALGEWQRKCGGEAQRKPVTWAFFEPSQLLCGNERRHQRKRRRERDCRFHHCSRFQAWSNLHFKPLGPVNQPLCVFAHASGAFQRWLGKVS